jgi:hypothetical protein
LRGRRGRRRRRLDVRRRFARSLVRWSGDSGHRCSLSQPCASPRRTARDSGPLAKGAPDSRSTPWQPPRATRRQPVLRGPSGDATSGKATKDLEKGIFGGFLWLGLLGDRRPEVSARRQRPRARSRRRAPARGPSGAAVPVPATGATGGFAPTRAPHYFEFTLGEFFAACRILHFILSCRIPVTPINVLNHVRAPPHAVEGATRA